MLIPKTREKETTEEEGRRKEKERLLAALLLLLIAETRDRLASLVIHTYKARSDSLFFDWISPAGGILRTAHLQAWNIGVASAAAIRSDISQNDGGSLWEPKTRDGLPLISHALEDMPYLRNFVQDALTGRYTTEGEFGRSILNVQQITARAELYANRLYGTAIQAWACASPMGTKFYWRLDTNENHCRDCPAWAEGSPYVLHTLPAFPGDGKSQCVTNCRCWLETEDGQRSLEI